MKKLSFKKEREKWNRVFVKQPKNDWMRGFQEGVKQAIHFMELENAR